MLENDVLLAAFIIGVAALFAALLGIFPPIKLTVLQRYRIGFLGSVFVLFAIFGSIYEQKENSTVDKTASVPTFTPEVRSAVQATATPTQLITVVVDSQKAWQETGVIVSRGTRVRIEVVSGQWTYYKAVELMQSGLGNGYVCGRDDCIEPMPMVAVGALIGRIGDQHFYVGSQATVTAEEDGELSLRINDGDAGLSDNEGVLTVRIKTY